MLLAESSAVRNGAATARGAEGSIRPERVTDEARVLESYGKLPLSFEKNTTLSPRSASTT